MAAHRYWRTVALEASAGGIIEATEFWLLAGTTRVDAAATIGGTAPLSGSLANLKDDDTGTGVTLPAKAGLTWDFGVGGSADVTDLRIGSANDPTKFPLVCGLAYSDDNIAWVQTDVFAGIVWPGARTKTASEQLGNTNKSVGYSIGNSGAAKVTTTTVEVWDNNGIYLPGKAPNSGTRQFEISRTAVASSGIVMGVGFSTRSAIDTARGVNNSLLSANLNVAYTSSGGKYVNGVNTSGYGALWTTGDVIQCVVDLSTGQVTFYKNGISQGVAGTISLTAGDINPFIIAAGSAGAASTSTIAVRTRGFTTSIAGAVPWESRTAITTNSFAGRSAALEPPRWIATPGYTPIGAVQPVPNIEKLRGDFLIGMGGAGNGRGVGRVKGTTKDKGTPNVPVSERVRLYREQDGLLIREVWSTPGTGAYSFDYIDEFDTYTVIAYDHDKAFRAVVANGLTLSNGGVELIP